MNSFRVEVRALATLLRIRIRTDLQFLVGSGSGIFLGVDPEFGSYATKFTFNYGT
jgi:hypothetical protein